MNSTALEDLDYDDFLTEAEATATVAISYKIPPPPPRITVTVHLGSNPKKIQDQKRNINLKTEYHQQLGDSFDYSNSDLHNVINIGRNAKTVIINKGEDHDEVEAYSPTSNFKLPTSTTRKNNTVTEQYLLLNRPSSRRSIPRIKKLHSRCFLHPKGKHSSFQCIILRKALGAPPPSADKDKKNQHEQNFF